MKRATKVLIASVWLTFSACNVPSTIVLPAQEKKLVLNCITIDKHPWSAYLGYSKDILADWFSQGVDSASIRIYENGALIETLVRDRYQDPYGDPMLGFGYVGTLTTPQAGKTYKIIVEKAGYTSIESTFTQPDSIVAESVEIKVVGPAGNGFNEFVNAQFRVGFTDPPGEDFYEIGGEIHTADHTAGQVMSFSFVDPAYSDLNGLFSGDLAFDDSYFDGKSVKLDFLSMMYDPNEYPEYTEVTIFFRHVSKEYYEYKKTTSLQVKTLHDAFAQPVVISNNIVNGYGIFGGITETKKAFHLNQ